MNDNLIKSELNNAILHLILNDPQNQNTLSLEMIDALNKKLQDASTNNKIKVIVISSTGNVFSAGHNLKDLNSKRSDPDNGKKYYDEIFNNINH